MLNVTTTGVREHTLVAVHQTAEGSLLRDGDVYQFAILNERNESVFDSGPSGVRYVTLGEGDACSTECRVAAF